MFCLCCGKEINTSNDNELQSGWHSKCAKKFFGTSDVPDIEFSDEELLLFAKSIVNRGYTVQGVQKKMSLHLTKSPEPRLTLVDYPNGYILKPQTDIYDNLPEYEHTAMLMAEVVGIRTVPHGLIKLQNQYAYITKRVDRIINSRSTKLLAMEDFCQLSGRMTEDKYRGSYEQCTKIITEYSSTVNLDLAEFFLRILFCFVIGNADMHLKNFSLREQASGERNYALSEAYDLLPVNIVNPVDMEETALVLNGKKSKLKKKDFVLLAQQCGINDTAIDKMIMSIVKKQSILNAVCDYSVLNEAQKKVFKELINSRIGVLSS